MIKANNVISDRGNPITNQIIITDTKKETETFQSYNSIIAVKGWTKDGKRKASNNRKENRRVKQVGFRVDIIKINRGR